MAEKLKAPARPEGIYRLLLRLPIWLYRARLGWLLGRRFLLLYHTGRRSGQIHRTVLEVAAYDQKEESYQVASGWGFGSDWYRNLLKCTEVTIQVGAKRLAMLAHPLSPEASGEAMVDYSRRHPAAARGLMRLLGMKAATTEAEYRKIGRELIPFVALTPRQVSRSKPEG